ncbi:hypothetical protein [Aquitalea sp. USM4]|uniref:hypothetical protein n=1 Tax=Aquitalea sp. USM4 TaxID=1590041 RepID=UPI00103BE5B1|nr:hypothetical protein [Aquitalea sp. USM4]
MSDIIHDVQHLTSSDTTPHRIPVFNMLSLVTNELCHYAIIENVLLNQWCHYVTIVTTHFYRDRKNNSPLGQSNQWERYGLHPMSIAPPLEMGGHLPWGGGWLKAQQGPIKTQCLASHFYGERILGRGGVHRGKVWQTIRQADEKNEQPAKHFTTWLAAAPAIA